MDSFVKRFFQNVKGTCARALVEIAGLTIRTGYDNERNGRRR